MLVNRASPDLISAYKTVSLFSELIGKPLKLVDGPAQQKGTTLSAPFEDPNLYILVERQIAHAYFRSDAKAKDRFLTLFVQKTALNAEKVSFPLDSQRLRTALSGIIDILDSHRVQHLWGRSYEGSFRRYRRYLQEQLRDLPALGFLPVMARLDAELPVETDLMPLFQEAFARVRGRSYQATLLTARWLLSRLVGQLTTEPERRLWALGEVLALSGSLGPAEAQYGDYTSARARDDDTFLQSRTSPLEALQADLLDEAAVEEVLADSEALMDELVRSVERRLSSPQKIENSTATWANGAPCTIRSIRIDAPAEPLTAEDLDTVERLRSLFSRAQGRRSHRLERSGLEVDVAAYIERHVTQNDLPVFRESAHARGFRSLVLVDRSGSMQEGSPSRIECAERAARILHQALRLPSVSLDVWGFQQIADGEVAITTFGEECALSDEAVVEVDGGTPLHIAIGAAVRHLSGRQERRHLFVVTDGEPIYATSTALVSKQELRSDVRARILEAEASGIDVTVLLIGESTASGTSYPITTDEMRYMFGPSRNWSRVKQQFLGETLIRSVSCSLTGLAFEARDVLGTRW